MSRITEALRATRIEAKVKQKDLAARLGISQAFLSDIERSRRELPEQHYWKLPDPIRGAVVTAAKAELLDRMRRLDHVGS